MKVRISIEGTAPLLMHNVRLANPLDPITRAMKVITKKRIKTDDDLLQLARLEFDGGLYISSDIGPFIPGTWIEQSLVNGGRITKQGKQVERGLFVIDNETPLLYKGPRDADGLWADDNYRLMSAVRVGQQRVMRCRPLFRTWAAEVDAEVDPGLLNLETLGTIVTDAGNMVGIGDYRPRYGRYTGTVEPL